MKRPPEMSRAAFQAALERNRFSGPVMFWFRDLDTKGHSYSGVFTVKGKLLRRATLAKLLADRKAREAHEEKLLRPALEGTETVWRTP